MQEIKKWLSNGQDYAAGVLLYQAVGTSLFYKNLFTSGNDAYRKNKLLEELKKLCPAGDVAPVDLPVIKNHIEPTLPAFKADEYPKYLKLTEQIASLYLQANRAKYTLNTEKKELVLLKTALVLKKLKRQITELYAVKDFYDANGHFPIAPKKATINDIADKPKKLQLLRQSNAKAKRRLKDPKCKNKAQTAALIEENARLMREIQIDLGRVKA